MTDLRDLAQRGEVGARLQGDIVDLPARDFSGGITDDYISAAPNQCKHAINYVLNSAKRYEPHPTTVLKNNGTRIAGRGRIDALFNLSDKALIAIVGGAFYKYIDESTPAVPLSFPDGSGYATRVFSPDTNAVEGYQKAYSMAALNGEYVFTSGVPERPFKLFFDGAGRIQGNYLGVPLPVGVDHTVNNQTGDLVDFYVYAVVLSRSYESGGRFKVDTGGATTFQVAMPKDVVPNIVVSVPGGYSPLYGDLRCELYRTVVSGTTFYKVSEGPLGVIGDPGVSDDDLRSRPQLSISTTNISSDNDEPLPAAYCTASAGRLFLAGLRDTNTNGIVDNEVIYSRYGVGYGFPLANRVVIDEKITGLRRVRNNPVIGTASSLYRLEEATRDLFVSFSFETTVGVVSSRSMVETNFGLFFLSRDGVYWSDSLKAIKLSDHIQPRINQVREKDSFYGFFEPEGKRIYFFFSNVSKFSFRNAFVLDLNFTRFERSGGVFTEYEEDPRTPFTTSVRSFVTYRGTLFKGGLNGSLSSFQKTTGYNEQFLGDFTNRSTLTPQYFVYESNGLLAGVDLSLIKNVGRVIFTLVPQTSGNIRVWAISDSDKVKRELNSLGVVGSAPINDDRIKFPQMNSFGSSILNTKRVSVPPEMRGASFQVRLEPDSKMEGEVTNVSLGRIANKPGAIIAFGNFEIINDRQVFKPIGYGTLEGYDLLVTDVQDSLFGTDKATLDGVKKRLLGHRLTIGPETSDHHYRVGGAQLLYPDALSTQVNYSVTVSGTLYRPHSVVFQLYEHVAKTGVVSTTDGGPGGSE